MAENSSQDAAEKTEDPTPKRLREARQKGNVAVSREVPHVLFLIALLVSITLIFPHLFARLAASGRLIFETLHEQTLDPVVLQIILFDVVTRVFAAIVPLLALFFLVALLPNVLQNTLVVSWHPLKPSLEKISLFKGAQRLFSRRSLVELIKAMGKLLIIVGLVGYVLWEELPQLPLAVTLEFADSFALCMRLARRVIGAALAVMLVLTAFDLIMQHQQWFEKLRMSKRELRDEHKETEGDPMIKARLRALRQERARQRMMAALPDATVVITNPQHYAVALGYRADQDHAPRVLAKGVDHLALRIKLRAQELKIPLVENPPLARALYGALRVTDEILPEHYEAVARIISQILQMRTRTTAQP